MSKSKLKVGIIGYGYMGKIRKAAIEKHSRLELLGIYDIHEFVFTENEKPYVFTSFETLLNKVDIVFVCTPNAYSPEICIEALKRGKHVFCEKPPGKNVSDIQNMMRFENENTKLMFGFNHRYHPGIMKAKILTDHKRLGKILHLRGIYGKSGGIHFSESWRNKKNISGGGILLDQGIHMLDLFCFFCENFEEIKCFTYSSFWNFEVEDNAFIILKNKNGQMASLHSSATLWKHTFHLEIILEQGYLIIDGLLSKTGSYGREKLIIGKRQFEDESHAIGNPSEEIIYFDRDLSWELEINEFIDCIDQNKMIKNSSSLDALKVMEIIEKAYKDSSSL